MRYGLNESTDKNDGAGRLAIQRSEVTPYQMTPRKTTIEPELKSIKLFEGNRFSEAKGVARRLTALTINKRTSIRATNPDIYKCLQHTLRGCLTRAHG